jgi:hypothetical protein
MRQAALVGREWQLPLFPDRAHLDRRERRAGYCAHRARQWCRPLEGAQGPVKEMIMAKGQRRSNREVRKPKQNKPAKTNASQPSQKEGVVRGLENFKH